MNKTRNKKKLIYFFIGFLFLRTVTAQQQNVIVNNFPQRETISLAGSWQFRTGEKSNLKENKLYHQVLLPGSLAENKFGKKDYGGTAWLTLLHSYIGPALYQREIIIPDGWKDKHIELFLEQCHLKSEVWVDHKEVGNPQNSMTVPHIYNLTDFLSPGKHLLTICVNNAEIFTSYSSAEGLPLMGHTTSRSTQTNWNGIIGRIELQAFDKVRIKSTQIFSDVKNRTAKVKLLVYNETESTAEGKINIFARSFNSTRFHETKHITTNKTIGPGQNEYIITVSMGDDVLLWDEFHPNLYKLYVNLESNVSNQEYKDISMETFGMCDFSAKGKQFSVNGKTVFLRGTDDAAAFPLTAHPPMDVDSWLKIYRTCKSYGINHMRFHSWCPPEAAFKAADLIGIYLQPEGPTGGRITMPVPENDYVTNEMIRIQNTFGNHPSFRMMSIGNELNTSFEAAGVIIKRLKKNDPRQLHAAGTNPIWNRKEGPKLPGIEDFFVASNTGGYDGSKNGYMKGPLRGAFHNPTVGYLENQTPSTDVDFSESIKNITIPVLSHEVGQHAVYPNYDERIKYKGVLVPENFDEFYKKLEKAGMADQAHDFFLSSGKWSSLLYKEEIEAALRTKGFGGFRLLDLHDYPGQNTALVGMLDVFYESKGLIDADQWREFCSPVVPLLRIKKLVWTNNEVLKGNVQVANYGENTIKKSITWILKDRNYNILAKGKLNRSTIKQGNLSTIGNLNIPLRNISAPSQLIVELIIDETNYHNQWYVWVYPEKINTVIPSDINLVENWTEAKNKLAKGEKVLLLSNKLGKYIQGSQATLFWSYEFFKHFDPAGTLGILCNPKHPALADFPTDFHQNWQWADLLKHSNALILDATPINFRPIIQVVDNKFRNHKLGNLLEAKVGEGKLMVCSMDITTDLEKRPTARQLRHSILNYMSSEDFNPKFTLDISLLDKMWEKQ